VTPLVSVLIPCHNAAAWLRATLESVLAQTWPHREIIVVDDGSTDNSAAIARSYADRGVTVIAQPNRGQSAAFNTALRAARGDFYEFLDADDLLAPDKLEHQVRRLQQDGADCVASGAWTRFVQELDTAVFKPEPVWRDLAPADWLVSSWMGGGMMHGAAWLVPRSVADRAGPWSEDLSLINDLDFFTRLLLRARRVLFVPEARTYYRSGLTTNAASQRSPAAMRSGYEALRRSREALLAAENSPRTRLAAATALQRFIFSTYPDGPEYVAEAERTVAELGGASLHAEGGRAFLFLSKLIGWKRARRLQRAWQARRASRLALQIRSR